jgi:1-acyl-sn-glycerol-3-phosphate acyltransferase
MRTFSRLLRQLTRGLGLITLLFVGLAVLTFRFPMIDGDAQQAWIKRWSIWVSRTLGLKIAIQGQIDPEMKSALIVANHSSWLDIVVINSIQPAAFIAKAEIEKWPVVGLLVARSGTLFIERGKRHAVHKVLQDAIERLKQGRFVAVFPEGTTNDGKSLLPFHGNMMEAAIRAKVPVQPLAITYVDAGGKLSDAIKFVGETTFISSLFKVLADANIRVNIAILQSEYSESNTRHDLASASALAIAAELGFNGEVNEFRTRRQNGL